jgi:hypothetical protein
VGFGWIDIAHRDDLCTDKLQQGRDMSVRNTLHLLSLDWQFRHCAWCLAGLVLLTVMISAPTNFSKGETCL